MKMKVFVSSVAIEIAINSRSYEVFSIRSVKK